MEHREAEEGQAPSGRDGDGRGRPDSGSGPRRARLQVAVVTGASSGIGAELVRLLQARGTRVVGLSRSPSKADEHEECDVGDRVAVEAAAARVLERHAWVDLLVCNAGIGARGDYLTVAPQRIEQVMRVNYLGSAWTTLAFLPALRRGSHLVNVCSVAGVVAIGPYSASKHAQLALSRSLAVELAPRGIHVHTILPGFVETPGFPQRTRWPRVLHPLIASPELVARRILEAVDHDRREIVVPRWYRPAAWAQALAPGLLANARARTSRRPPRSP
ncbi:MAG TPA: SDR family oxidoreductase [Gaiellaceae bacterium]|nr:SDR family oxidoreductase [Gaiellaceae bacterium]